MTVHLPVPPRALNPWPCTITARAFADGAWGPPELPVVLPPHLRSRAGSRAGRAPLNRWCDSPTPGAGAAGAEARVVVELERPVAVAAFVARDVSPQGPPGLLAPGTLFCVYYVTLLLCLWFDQRADATKRVHAQEEMFG
eukprot:gene49157-19116_t